MINPMDLSGKHIILTGASSGIGRATALYLSKLGAQLTLIARNEQRLQDVLAQLEGERHTYRIYDLAHREGICDLIADIVAQQGKVDGLAYCAGVEGLYPLKLLTPSRLDEVMTINTLSFIEMARVLSNRKYRKPSVSFVAISSVAGNRGFSAKVAYCSSKAALDSAARALAHELAPAGIRVNTLAPGWIETEMYQQHLDSVSDSLVQNELSSLQYLGLGKPEDVASAIAFMLSDASQFITGTQLAVDGGYLS